MFTGESQVLVRKSDSFPDNQIQKNIYNYYMD